MNVEVLVYRSCVRVSQVFCFESLSSVMAVSVACAKSLQKVLEGPCWEERPSLDPLDVVGLRTTASIWNVPKKHGPHGELFFFLVNEEPVVVRKTVDFGPFVPAEASKACALIGLHMMAEEAVEEWLPKKP